MFNDFHNDPGFGGVHRISELSTVVFHIRLESRKWKISRQTNPRFWFIGPLNYPPWELTYPTQSMFEDDFSFPKDGIWTRFLEDILSLQ